MRNISALILAVIAAVAFWSLTNIPVVWAWMNEPAWHWGVVSGVILVIIDRLVKLTKWRGDDALWAILKKDILGRR